MRPTPPSQDELSAYLDGELSPTRLAEIEALAATDASLASEITRLRAETQQLRAALAALPSPEPAPRLDPAALRRGLRQRRQRRLATAASLMLALGLGITGGWYGRELAAPAPGLPMADAVQAYHLFSGENAPPVDFAANEPGALQHWLDRHFDAAAPMPDLGPYGFHPVGARLMATEQGAAAVVLYKDERGETVLFYIRPPGRTAIGRGSRRDDGLVAQYWADRSYHYAVVSVGSSPRSAAVQQALAPLI